MQEEVHDWLLVPELYICGPGDEERNKVAVIWQALITAAHDSALALLCTAPAAGSVESSIRCAV
jgi:hypothetical protein